MNLLGINKPPFNKVVYYLNLLFRYFWAFLNKLIGVVFGGGNKATVF